MARDDVRLTIATDGTARIEHRVLLLVSGGPLTSLSIRGVDADAVVEPGAYVVPEPDDKQGSLDRALELTVKRTGGEAGARTDLEASIAGRGIARGRFVAVVRYKTDLGAALALRADGASARLDWVGPEWDDGLETTRATFVFPAAPTEPRTIEPTQEETDADAESARGTFLSTLLKKPDVDALEVVRPYAARGERVVWSVRADIRAFAFLDAGRANARPSDPDGHAPPELRSPLKLVQNPRQTGVLIAALALFVFVTSLTAAHAIEVRHRASRSGSAPRPLLPLPLPVRAVIAGTLFVGGLALQFWRNDTLLGALAVALVVVPIWHLPVHGTSALRGPGTWLAVRANEAFYAAPRRRSLFDARTWSGAAFLVCLLVGFGGVGYQLAKSSLPLGILVAFDVVPLLALFLAGGRTSLAPDASSDPIELYRAVTRKVERAREGTRVVPRLRIPEGQRDADEMRVVFLPARAARGLRAIELAVAFASGPGGHVVLPEIILRFEEGSACEELARTFEPFARAQRGRRPDERVLTFVPKLPTVAVTADLVIALLDATGAPPEPNRNVRAAPQPSRRRTPLRSAAQSESLPGALTG